MLPRIFNGLKHHGGASTSTVDLFLCQLLTILLGTVRWNRVEVQNIIPARREEAEIKGERGVFYSRML